MDIQVGLRPSIHGPPSLSLVLDPNGHARLEAGRPSLRVEAQAEGNLLVQH